jgi:glucose-1-phosphate adenylyltransferase
MIAGGCQIDGEVDYSVLFANVTVEEGAKVNYSIVMPGTVIKAGAVVQYAIVAEDAVIGENAVIGECPENMTNRDDWGIAVVGNGVTVGPGAQVPPKAMLENDIGGAQS